MKTPEEMAEEYLDQDKVACDAINHDAEDLVKDAFLAGYKAGQAATWEEWRNGKLFENNEDAKAAYKKALEDK